jgi:hypothetical protein
MRGQATPDPFKRMTVSPAERVGLLRSRQRASLLCGTSASKIECEMETDSLNCCLYSFLPQYQHMEPAPQCD